MWILILYWKFKSFKIILHFIIVNDFIFWIGFNYWRLYYSLEIWVLIVATQRNKYILYMVTKGNKNEYSLVHNEIINISLRVNG